MPGSYKYPADPPAPPSHSLSYHRAGLAGGLPTLQLESGDDPRLHCAAAGHACVNHHSLPGLEPGGTRVRPPGTPVSQSLTALSPRAICPRCGAWLLKAARSHHHPNSPPVPRGHSLPHYPPSRMAVVGVRAFSGAEGERTD